MTNNSNNQGASARERACRRLQAAGQRVAGERGGRAANRLSEALRLGRVDYCDDPKCPNCAPINPN